MSSAKQVTAQPEPVFWYRPSSSNPYAYAGPLHNSVIEPVHKTSGAWVPLYASPLPAQPLTSGDERRGYGPLIGDEAADAIAALVTERDAAVVDAERYRWLRAFTQRLIQVIRIDTYAGDEVLCEEDLDAAIDAIRAQEQKP